MLFYHNMDGEVERPLLDHNIESYGGGQRPRARMGSTLWYWETSQCAGIFDQNSDFCWYNLSWFVMKMIHIVFYSWPTPKILFWLSGNKRRCYGDTGYLLGSVGRSDIELDGDICKQARGNCCVGICLIDPIKILSPPRATIKYQMTYSCYATIRYAVILGSKVMT